MSEPTVAEEAIVIERIFDAPAALIWRMWTQPDHFKQWYAPEGFRVPVAEMDVRIGGRHVFCMERVAAEGTMQMWTAGEYTEVTPHQRLAYTEYMADEQGHPTPAGSPTTTQVIVTLEDVGGRTKMVMRHVGLPANQGSARQGWEQAFTKMEEYLTTIRSKQA
jgi:uncharacterized protein YndB with AHSA1/START domain